MFDSHTDTRAGVRVPSPITVFPNRRRFEAEVSRLLRSHTGEFAPCAVLHLALRCRQAGTGSIGRRALNLAGNTLRVALPSGALAYLGDAEFAVLLKDCDQDEAEEYAHAVAGVIEGFALSWDDEDFFLTARIGGVMARDCRDGARLLGLAAAAGDQARGLVGHKVRILGRPELWVAPPDEAAEARLTA